MFLEAKCELCGKPGGDYLNSSESGCCSKCAVAVRDARAQKKYLIELSKQQKVESDKTT